ncbi:hypothetical protein K458DRAFT_320208 [Lentithecium fluviatile CBS 122367]|uniref:Rhodopsin domain-containing protein n=1 Tax=Lentithecium fluviatile CBS 122367 TaxID=1168545 RepID=A0A6G1IGA9_9PLEO|nr:hypothetical protein K458DRAFT_320208 [Lentithecium fluviatile CBS 122367]
MTIVALLFMGLRFFCKAAFTRRFGIDDGLLLFAWILTLVFGALVTASVRFGLGKHDTDNSPEDRILWNKFLFFANAFALTAIPISKTSFAVTLLRIAPKRWHKWLIWFIIISMNVAMLLLAILLLSQCRPVEKSWNREIAGSCLNRVALNSFSIFAGSYSAFLDMVLAMFPGLIIWNLQMGKREKLGVIFAMSLGFLAGIVAAVKTSFLRVRYADKAFSIGDVVIWSTAETSVTIIAASIPFFRVLIKHASTKGQSGPRRQSYRLGSFAGAHGTESRHLTTVRGQNEMGDDNSDVGILGRWPFEGRIVKVSAVTVEFSKK